MPLNREKQNKNGKGQNKKVKADEVESAMKSIHKDEGKYQQIIF